VGGVVEGIVEQDSRTRGVRIVEQERVRVNRTVGGVNRTGRRVNRTVGGVNRTGRRVNRTVGGVNRTVGRGIVGQERD
jgi:hypothetical protein